LFRARSRPACWGRSGSQPLEPVGAIASYDSGTGQLTIWENSLSFTWCGGSCRSTSGTGDDECGRGRAARLYPGLFAHWQLVKP